MLSLTNTDIYYARTIGWFTNLGVFKKLKGGIENTLTHSLGGLLCINST
jgi:hypothetical protein